MAVTANGKIQALEARVAELEAKIDDLADYAGGLARATLNPGDGNPRNYVGLSWKDGQWRSPYATSTASMAREREYAQMRAEATRR